MNVLAYDFSKTFYNLSKLPAKANGMKKILIYGAYAWGLLFLYTLALLIVDLTNVKGGFHFGSNIYGKCWVETNLQLLLSFGIPLILALTLNAIFFIRSVVGLCSAMRVARKAKKSSTHVSYNESFTLHENSFSNGFQLDLLSSSGLD